jgi:hypothetical protein
MIERSGMSGGPDWQAAQSAQVIAIKPTPNASRDLIAAMLVRSATILEWISVIVKKLLTDPIAEFTFTKSC